MSRDPLLDLACAPCGRRFGSVQAFAQHVDALHRGLASETLLRCQHCGGHAKFMPSSAAVYGGRDYGPVWRCEPCDALVGCHKGGARPKGTLATKPMRLARKRAHNAFDRIWLSGEMARPDAYGWLAAELNIHRDDCHIALFCEDRCAEVIALVAQRARALRAA